MSGFGKMKPASNRGTLVRHLALLLVLAVSAGLAAPSWVAAKDEKDKKMSRREVKAAVEKLPEKYRAWVEEVEVLITEEELATFLSLEKDYQRDAFIKQFWEVRDPYRATARNEYQDRWEANARLARGLFGSLDDERSKMILLNGPPAVRIESKCGAVIWPLEAWFYAGSDRVRGEFFVVFYRRWGAGPFRIFDSGEGLDSLFADSAGSSGEKSLQAIARGCLDGDKIAAAISWVLGQGLDYDLLQQRLREKPESRSGEWVSAFNSYSTDLPEGAVPLPAKLAVEYPGRYQNRTVLQGIISVPVSGAGLGKMGDHSSYNLHLTGEVLQNDTLFDNFRYRFDFPPSEAGGQDAVLPVVFQRYLRPGDYRMIVKVEDVNSGKVFREERTISVPVREEAAPIVRAPDNVDAETARLLAEANAALSNGETTVKILPPHGELHTGMLRFDTLTTGSNINRVTFALDGKDVLIKKTPPYSVELDLGSIPRTRNLTVTAYDAAGRQVASDDLLINASGHRFKVRLAEPRRGQRYTGSLLARAEVEVPEGQTVERVEFFLNETRVATLYQAPYVQPVVLPKSEEIAYVRAVAYLPDGNTTEALTFVNAPENLEEIDIDFVELYTTVLDRKGRPVQGLEQKDFTVFEDGVRQEVARFEVVTDLPIHAAIALDVSASMDKDLEKARQAALRFLQETVRPKDRAALVTFNDHPNLTVKFTNELSTLAGGLTGLKAERGTSLYDSIIFTLYYFNGLKGQRAVLLLSDGKDEGSRFTFEDALEYARRAGVTIYSIGLGEKVDKKKLEKIAEETGGTSFFLKSVDELDAIYAAIEEELRSKYLIAYQSGNTSGGNDFRTIDVKVGQPGLEAKTLRGYYP
jgi:VWFA-related protein